MALSIDILANTREAQRGVKDLSKALDDTADALDDLARDSDRAGDKVEDSFRDMVRAAGRADDAVAKVGKSAPADIRKISDGAKEVTQELGQNFGEAVSSVRGNIADLGQVGQDTLGGLAATLAGSGPGGLVGAAALGAGAFGLGLVTAELEKQQEAADEMRRRLSAAYQGAAEDGRNFIDTQQIIADGLDLIFNPDRADEYKTAVADANRLGLDLSDIIAASNGDLEAQKAVQQEINDLLAEANSYELTGTTNKKTLKSEVSDLQSRWQSVVDTTAEYADKTRAANEVTSSLLMQMMADATSAQEEVDNLGNKLITLDTGEQIVIDIETGQAHQNLDRFKGDADGVIKTLNGSEILITAEASVAEAQRVVNNFITHNDGKSFRLNGRVTVDPGWD